MKIHKNKKLHVKNWQKSQNITGDFHYLLPRGMNSFSARQKHKSKCSKYFLATPKTR